MFTEEEREYLRSQMTPTEVQKLQEFETLIVKVTLDSIALKNRFKGSTKEERLELAPTLDKIKKERKQAKGHVKRAYDSIINRQMNVSARVGVIRFIIFVLILTSVFCLVQPMVPLLPNRSMMGATCAGFVIVAIYSLLPPLAE